MINREARRQHLELRNTMTEAEWLDYCSDRIMEMLTQEKLLAVLKRLKDR